MGVDNDGDGDSLKPLVRSSPLSYGEEHNQLVDNFLLAEMMRLRQMGLFRKEDVQEYGLVWLLCMKNYFAENRFQFLVEWNPTSLTQNHRWEYLPLHNAANKTLQSFRIV